MGCYVLPIPLLRSLDSHQATRFYKYFVPTGRRIGLNHEIDLAPPASAICWKCYNSETCDARVCDLHKVIHRKCGTKATWH